jgi:hypothetical protein
MTEPEPLSWDGILQLCDALIQQLGIEEVQRIVSADIDSYGDPAATPHLGPLFEDLDEQYGPGGYRYLVATLAAFLHFTDRPLRPPVPVYPEAVPPDEDDGCSLADIAEQISVQGDQWWRCIELDRSDADGAPTFEPSPRNLIFFLFETYKRDGLERARSFVRAVEEGNELHEEHAALIANIRRRFGELGLARFTGGLSALCDAADADHAELGDEGEAAG